MHSNIYGPFDKFELEISKFLFGKSIIFLFMIFPTLITLCLYFSGTPSTSSNDTNIFYSFAFTNSDKKKISADFLKIGK